jgi:hypothetical protein
MKGAGNNNFGVVTKFTFKLIPIPSDSDPPFTMYQLNWNSTSDPVSIFSTWQEYIKTTPDELVSQLMVYHDSLASTGVYIGDEKSLTHLITPLLQVSSRVTFFSLIIKVGSVSSLKLMPMNYTQVYLNLAGCNDLSSCLQQANTEPDLLNPLNWKSKSSYASQSMSKDGILNLLQWMGPGDIQCTAT